MSRETKSKDQLLKKVQELERRLEEAEETLRAIRNGEVDALYVEGPEGDQIFTLKGVDQTYRTLIENMNEGAVTTTADGTILYANKAFAEMIQAPHELIVGSSIDQYIAPENKPLFEALFQKGFKKSAEGEIAFQTGEDSPVQVYVSINTVLLDDEQVLCIAVTDLTEQKRQEEIVQSERLSRAILEAVGEAIVVCDNEGRIIRANHAAQRVVENPVLLKSFGDVFAIQMIPKNNSEAAAPFSVSQVLEGDSLRGEEVLLRKQNEEELYFLLSASHLRSEEGIIGCVLVLTDTTELKQLEMELEAESERLAITLLSIGDAVISTDLEGRIILMNRVAESLTGWSQKEAIGQSLNEVFHIINEKTREPCENPVQKVLQSGKIVGLANDTVLISRAGTERVVADVGSPILSRDGNIIGVILVFRDITDHKRAEEALHESESRYRTFFEKGPDGVVIVDPKIARPIEFNEQACRQLGYSREEFAQLRLSDIEVKETAEEDQEHVRKVRNEEYHDFETLQRTKQGEIRHVHVTAQIIEAAGGNVYHCIWRDITERKRTEEELHRSRDNLELQVWRRTAELNERAKQLARLSSQVTLAEQRERRHISEILHDDLQQLLVAAKIGQETLIMDIDNTLKSVAEHVLYLINKSIDSSRSLTAELSPPILRTGNFTDSLGWLARWMDENHGFEVKLQIEAGIVLDRKDLTVLLFQSIRELLLNVIKHAGVKSATLKMEHKNDELRIVVRDRGVGFNPETVGMSEGDDRFGLISIRERLLHLGGRFEIESAPNKGSTISLTVPLDATRSPEKEVQDLSRETHEKADTAGTLKSGKKIRVLIVDDHPVVRQGMSSMLGMQSDIEIVGEASEGEKAIQLARELVPDVILMDISMPNMGGLEATRIIHSEIPHIRIIALSMYNEDEQAAAMIDAGASVYRSKSGSIALLLASVRGEDQ